MSRPSWLQHVMRVPTVLLIGLVQGYRYLLSPWLGSSCRFTPTCSAYALGALQDHGAAVGAYLAARRILRCRPGCPGGHDPVPEAGAHLFTKFLTPATAPAQGPLTEPGAQTPKTGSAAT